MKDIVAKLNLEATKARAQKAIQDVAESKVVVAAATAGDSLKGVVGKSVEIASEGYRRTGVKTVVDRAGEKLDEISGKAILEEVRLMVEKQAFYNDVLATKLQEALDRIAELEARLSRT